MIKAARAGDDRLFGRAPFMHFDPPNNYLPSLDVGVLHVDSADTKLLVPKVLFIVRRHIVFYEIAVTLDVANKISFVAPLVEIAVADLSIVVGPYCVIALADVNHDMNVSWQSVDRHVDRIDRRADLLVSGHGEVWLVNLKMLTARFDQAPKVLMEEFAEVGNHPIRIVIKFVVSHRGEKMRTGHGDLDWLARERRRRLKLLYQSEIDRIRDRSPANRRRMKHVRIVLGNRFGTGLALK